MLKSLQHMMLALLIYCYSNGIFSSRKIARATYRDISVRYLTADTYPDHDTICKFRRENLSAISAAFIDTLQLA
jgi:transposase